MSPFGLPPSADPLVPSVADPSEGAVGRVVSRPVATAGVLAPTGVAERARSPVVRPAGGRDTRDAAADAAVAITVANVLPLDVVVLRAAEVALRTLAELAEPRAAVAGPRASAAGSRAAGADEAVPPDILTRAELVGILEDLHNVITAKDLK